MYIDLLALLAAFACGVLATLAIATVVAQAYSRISGLPSPSGVVHRSAPLPFILKDENAEAKIEREQLARFEDQVPGLGR